MQSQKIMMTERISGNDLLKYLPQQPPFLLISALESVTEKGATTSFEIDANHVMVENGYLTEGGLIENMAQTIAAGSGFRASLKGEKPTIGMIGSVKRLNITKRPSINDKLLTIIKEITDWKFSDTYEQALEAGLLEALELIKV